MKEILFLLTAILFSIVNIVCYSKLSQKKIAFNYLLVIVIIFSGILASLNSFYNTTFFKVLISFLIMLITNEVIFKDRFKTTVYYTLIISIISMIIDISFSIGLSLIAKNVESLLNNSYIICGYTLLIMTIQYLIIKTKKIDVIINKVYSYYIKTDLIIYLGIPFMIVLNILSALYGLDYSNYSLYVLGIIVTSILLLIIIIFAINNYKKAALKIKNECLLDNISKYETVIDDYRAMKHNLTNDLLTVKTLCSKKNQAVINDIINKYQKNYEWVNKVNTIPKGIQGLFYIKLRLAKDKKIIMNIESNKQSDLIKSLKPKTYRVLCEMLGITLDNAIEAAIETKEKVISVFIDQTNSLATIKIINIFANNINLEKIGSKNYSTKNRNSGIGLEYISKIKDPSIKYKTKIINNLFIVEYKVKLKKAV